MSNRILEDACIYICASIYYPPQRHYHNSTCLLTIIFHRCSRSVSLHHLHALIVWPSTVSTWPEKPLRGSRRLRLPSCLVFAFPFEPLLPSPSTSLIFLFGKGQTPRFWTTHLTVDSEKAPPNVPGGQNKSKANWSASAWTPPDPVDIGRF